MNWLLKPIDTLLDRIFSVVGAVVFSQLPQFMLLYTDVVAGALAEAKKNVAVYQKQAASTGKSLSAFIQKHLGASDPDFQASGRAMEAALGRIKEYERFLTEMKTSAVWQKPFLFFQHLDSDLLDAVIFTPAIPANLEGAIYALLGILFGLLFYNVVIKAPLILIAGKKKRKEIAYT